MGVVWPGQLAKRGGFLHEGGVNFLMKKSGCLVVLVVLAVVVLRLNLPPANVSAAVDFGDLQSKNIVTRVVSSVAREAMVSDEVANWRYRDYVVFRTAKSERLGWSALGLPFSDWKVDTGGE